MRVLLPLLLIACGTRVELPTPTTTPDSAVIADTSTSGPVECVDSAGRMPNSLKTCTGDADCAVRSRQSDCCGSIVMVGVRSNVASAFQTCEDERRKGLPLCDCLSQPTKTEDGREIPPDSTAIARCTTGLCTSLSVK